MESDAQKPPAELIAELEALRTEVARLQTQVDSLQKALQESQEHHRSLIQDVTERKAVERMKAEFISIVSHELRTPLTSMQGALSLLVDGLVDPSSDRGRRTLEIAALGVDSLVRIVDDVLDLKQLESGALNLIWRSHDVVDLINRAVQLMQPIAEPAEIQFFVSATPFLIEGDGDRIVQVLTNLLSNAIKFSPPASPIWIAVQQESAPSHQTLFSKQALFCVCDSGRGISSDKLNIIFEPFQQVDASDARQKGGTGLGLAICRSIVEQHGGQIWVESVLGQGSQFYFTIPIRLKADEQANFGDR